MADVTAVETQVPRVLLAEDDRFLRKAAEVALERRGFKVLATADGEEALRVARDQSPNLILLDMFMPKMQGLEVLRALKQDAATAAIPVIIMSNVGEASDRRAATEAGALGYFIKSSLDLESLANLVKQALSAPPSGEGQ
jgi:CheY-like chemotaxis protein